MTITFTELTQWLGLIWWPFVRLTGLFLIAPFFGDKAIPMRVKILFAFVFSLLLAPMINTVPPFNPFSIEAIIFTLYQLVFGFLIGFSVMIFFTIFLLLVKLFRCRWDLRWPS
ncbi:flagellar biosynthesis protein FliR [Vibrio variabilis]|uniref:Flagellar biosynthesis protein FliR n=1 Tax=Vibrio variabilis TaxID=990271 RepID=A0ABQ0JFI7_9VIBR|nr:flagellar biosynthesis protein FliR [Vibrio variabilis]